MNKTSMIDTHVFQENEYVRYKHLEGYINFITDDYITICISKGNHRSHDVCVLVYPYQYHLIERDDLK